LAFFAPSGVQIVHALENHKHPVCYAENITHLHENNTECDFHFYKVNPPYISNNTYQLIATVKKTVLINASYNFFLKEQPLSYLLRGPPAFYS
jgi:hypothetical protein